jgi:putative copper export protein
MIKWLLFFHLLGATVWVGGHLFIGIKLLPKALKTGDKSELLNFERNYESIGMPALILQIITGLWLSYIHESDLSKWFDFSNHIGLHISIKLLLLFITLTCAIIANKVLIPKIDSPVNFKILSVLIYFVTVSSVLFVLTGLSFRVGIW